MSTQCSQFNKMASFRRHTAEGQAQWSVASAKRQVQNALHSGKALLLGSHCDSIWHVVAGVFGILLAYIYVFCC